MEEVIFLTRKKVYCGIEDWIIWKILRLMSSPWPGSLIGSERYSSAKVRGKFRRILKTVLEGLNFHPHSRHNPQVSCTMCEESICINIPPSKISALKKLQQSPDVPQEIVSNQKRRVTSSRISQPHPQFPEKGLQEDPYADIYVIQK